MRSMLVRSLLAALGLIAVTHGGAATAGPGEFTLPLDDFYYDKVTVKGGRLYVGSEDGELRCHRRVAIRASSGTITQVVLIREGSWALGVSYVNGDGAIHFHPIDSMPKVDANGVVCPDLYTPAAKPPKGGKPLPTLKAEIPVSNAANTFDVTCDGKYAVVVGTSTGKPVSLTDLRAGEEVDVLEDPALASFVSICEDGVTVLVVFTDGSDASSIRRLRIEGGQLVDTGEKLQAAGTSQFRQVLTCPGSSVGIALLNEFDSPHVSKLVTFTNPGLTIIDTASFGGDAHSAAVSPLGDRAYVSGGKFGSPGGTILGFTLDRATGALGDAPVLTISNVAPSYPRVFETHLAVSADGATLDVVENQATQDVPGPQVGYFDTVTGARTGAFTSFVEDPEFEPIRTISTVRRCGPPRVACADIPDCLEALRAALPDPATATGPAAKLAKKLHGALLKAKAKAQQAAAATGSKSDKLFAKAAKGVAGVAKSVHDGFRSDALTAPLLPIDDAVKQFFDHLPPPSGN